MAIRHTSGSEWINDFPIFHSRVAAEENVRMDRRYTSIVPVNFGPRSVLIASRHLTAAHDYILLLLN
jgi:hypothetical protein